MELAKQNKQLPVSGSGKASLKTMLAAKMHAQQQLLQHQMSAPGDMELYSSNKLMVSSANSTMSTNSAVPVAKKRKRQSIGSLLDVSVGTDVKGMKVFLSFHHLFCLIILLVLLILVFRSTLFGFTLVVLDIVLFFILLVFLPSAFLNLLFRLVVCGDK